MKSAKQIKRATKPKNGTVARKGRSAGGSAVAIIRPLTASGLKDVLWETLLDLKSEAMLPNRADAIAAQSREILRTVKVQLQVAGQSKRAVPQEIIAFAEGRLPS
jgi:hypothetical protein